MYCVYCGHRNDDDAVYCVNCGKYIEGSLEGDAAPPKRHRNHKGRLILGLVIGAAVLITCIICVIALTRRPSAKPVIDVPETKALEDGINGNGRGGSDNGRSDSDSDNARGGSGAEESAPETDIDATVPAMPAVPDKSIDPSLSHHPGEHHFGERHSGMSQGDGLTGQGGAMDMDKILPRGDGPWIQLSTSGSALIQDKIYLVNEDALCAYDEQLEEDILFTLTGRDDYFQGVLINGTMAYVNIGTAYRNSTILYAVDLETGEMTEAYRPSGPISMQGIIGNAIYYDAYVEDDDWIHPQLYCLDLETFEEIPLGYEDCHMDYVCDDFLVSMGQRSGRSARTLNVLSPDGSNCTKLSARAQRFEVAGDTVYYSEVLGNNDDHPCAIYSYNVSTGEKHRVFDKFPGFYFELTDGAQGAVTSYYDDETDELSIFYMDFVTGQTTEIFGEYSQYKSMNGHIYIMTTASEYSEIYEWEPGDDEPELIYTAPEDFMIEDMFARPGKDTFFVVLADLYDYELSVELAKPWEDDRQEP